MPWSTQQPLLSKAKNREKQDKEGACSVERKHKKRHTVSEVIYEWQVEADEYKKKTGVGMFLNCKKKKKATGATGILLFWRWALPLEFQILTSK